MLGQLCSQIEPDRRWWLTNDGAPPANAPSYKQVCQEWFVSRRQVAAASCGLHGVANRLWPHWHGVRAPPQAKLLDLAKKPRSKRGRK
jgi:hypothetical protein